MAKIVIPQKTVQVELPVKRLRATRIYLGSACFLAGAAMMIIEISAFRLLAPLFGNSVYTWTALIGVILIAFSAGGFIGGKLADRRAGLEVLGWLLAGASILTFFIPALHALFGERLSSTGFVAGPITISLFLFAVPGALLGAISPAAVRYYSLTQKDTHVGAAAGTISMLGSLGSFVGTFLSGFVLLANFGVRSIILGTAALLLMLALTAFVLARNPFKQQLPIILSGLLAAGISWSSGAKPGPHVIYQHESFYHHIQVAEGGESPNKRRVLNLDSTTEGGMNPDDGSLILDYQHYWRLGMLREKPIESALFIGAGAFGMPEEVSREFPKAAVDVAEIDPHVIEVGRRFFKLDEHPRVTAHAGDARHFLRVQAAKRWDLIFGDAYNGVHAIPSHLATREFFQLVSDRLNEEGAFVMNAITAVQGEHAELLGGVLATLRAVFPHVEVFAVQGSRQIVQNVILLATKKDWSPLITERFYAPSSWQHRLTQTHVTRPFLPNNGPIFTDDFNPVDAIIARGLLQND